MRREGQQNAERYGDGGGGENGSERLVIGGDDETVRGCDDAEI